MEEGCDVERAECKLLFSVNSTARDAAYAGNNKPRYDNYILRASQWTAKFNF